MEFHPVPDDLSALSEVAGDEELVLEEETLDSDNGYSERWVPKIEDVDEDEVVAAEERGENIYDAEAEDEEEDENGGGGRNQRPRRVARRRLRLRISAAQQPSARATTGSIATADRRAAVAAPQHAWPSRTPTAISRSSPTC